MTNPETNTQQPEMDLKDHMTQRRDKLNALRAQGQAYPNQFKRDVLAACLHGKYAHHEREQLEQEGKIYHVSGRIMLKRIMGKASFIQIQDMSGQIQAYVKRDNLKDGLYADFKTWDLGDIVGISGTLFRTKTNELTLLANDIQLLTKSLRPLPDKFHGLADQELRYRKRYLDLIMNPDSRRVFEIRTQIMKTTREFLNTKGFMEVETPMMQSMPGGAAARPFITHHNALDLDLYLRIAPELYLKRLVVGGFERVYEINRNFRNEGLSTRHNPEFTMLEFYQAYATYEDLMDMTEGLLKTLCEKIHGTTTLTYQDQTYDLGHPFKRMSVKESICHFNHDVSMDKLNSLEDIRQIATRLDIPFDQHDGPGKVLIEIFEKTVEGNLNEPTFITQYPTEVSPLSRLNDDDPSITDRFEFFVAGKEIANGFSELNDPEDQHNRFMDQVKKHDAGDMEAMHYDADYIEALEYGLPPTAGEGIGMDRLTMLLANCSSIRDVLLFPQMKPILKTPQTS